MAITSYPVLISEDSTNTSRNYIFYVPDLKLKFTLSDTDREKNQMDIVIYAQKKVQNYIEYLQEKNIVVPLPKKLKEYRLAKESHNGIWTKLYIDMKSNLGVFAKTLPYIGFASNFAHTFSQGIMSLLALRLTFGADKRGNILGIITIATGLFLTFLIYNYSGAASGLTAIGSKLDNFFKKKPKGAMLEETTLVNNNAQNNYYTLNQDENVSSLIAQDESYNCEDLETTNRGRNYVTSTGYICTRLGLYGLMCTNVTLSLISIYQELHGLADRATKQSTIIPEKLIYIIIYLLLVSNGITSLTFGGSFMELAAQSVDKALAKRVNKTSNDSHARDNHNTQQTIALDDEDDNESASSYSGNNMVNSL